MIALTYVSSATELFSEDALTKLLTKCRENNSKLGVTGLLLYKDGNIMQTLEGPGDVTRQLYAKISNDSRHHGVITLLDEDIAERSFPEWTMAFKNLSKLDAKSLPGYSEFMHTPLSASAFQDNPTKAQKLLLRFRRSLGGG